MRCSVLAIFEVCDIFINTFQSCNTLCIILFNIFKDKFISMKNFDIEEFEREQKRIDDNFTRTEQEGLKNILKHFDRIHDKLFTFNNILIAGFFAISKIENTISVKNIVIPILNLCFLIFIEYEMMEKSRFESSIKTQDFDKYDSHSKRINRTNLYSLLSILTTLTVTIIFLYFLFSNYKNSI